MTISHQTTISNSGFIITPRFKFRHSMWITYILLTLSARCLLGDRVMTSHYTDQTDGFHDYIIDDPQMVPYFDNSTEKNVTIQAGESAYLHCVVRQLGSKQVSWVRQTDNNILTIGDYKYTNEMRFSVLPQLNTGDWVLQLKYAQPQDSGVYECQVGTEVKISQEIHLKVEEATTKIIGGKTLRVMIGSSVDIICEVSALSVFVFWKHNGTQITSESDRYSIIKNNRAPTISKLTIKSVRPTDSGEYICKPLNASPTSINLIVIEGERASPMLHGRASGSIMYFNNSYYVTFLLLCVHLLLLFIRPR